MNQVKKHFWASKPEDVPKKPHWAIMHADSINADDGYGETRRTDYLGYEVFLDEQEWKNQVRELAARTGFVKPFLALYIVPAQVTTTITVDVAVDHKPIRGYPGSGC